MYLSELVITAIYLMTSFLSVVVYGWWSLIPTTLCFLAGMVFTVMIHVRHDVHFVLSNVDNLVDVNHDIQKLISAGHFNGSSALLKLFSDLDHVVRDLAPKGNHDGS